jgi:hypothetical protein
MAFQTYQLRADVLPNAAFTSSGLLNALVSSCRFATDGTGDITCGAVHGLSAGQLVRFSTQGGSLPVQINYNGQYFVLAVGLTTTKLRISLTAGGSPILFT